MADFASLTVQLELQQAAFAKGMADAAKKLDQVGKSAKKTQDDLSSLAKGFQQIAAAAKTVTAAYATMKSGEAIIRAADDIKKLEASFTALTGDAAKGADMLQRVINVADKTGAPLADVGAAMQRITIALGDMGASNQQVADLTETFLKLGAIGGTSAADAANALRQLGQGLAAGKLQGDELRSVLENMPLVAKEIAKEFGVTTGELKKLGAEGQLTGPRIANALLKATEEVDKKFALLPVTLEQGINRLETRWTLFLASFDKASSLGATIGVVLNYIADIFKRWTTELANADKEFSTVQLVATALRITVEAIAVLVANVVFVAEALTRAFAAAAAEAYAIVTLDWSKVGEAWAASEKQSAQARNDLDAFEQKILGIKKAADAAARSKSDLLTGGKGGGGDDGKKAAKEAEALQKRADAIAASVNPLFAFNQAMAEYTMLLEKGVLSETNFALAKEKATATLNAAGDAVRAATDPLFVYNQELEKLQRLYDAAAISAETLAKAQEAAKAKMDEASGQKKEKTLLEQMKELAETAGQAMGDFFGDLITGSATAEEAFKKMASTILSKIAEMVAAAAAAFIIKSLFGGGGGNIAGGSGSLFSAPVAAMSAANSALMSGAAATEAAVSSFARGPAAPTLSASDATMAATAGNVAPRPELNVVVNNNAGDAVSTRMNDSGDLEITIDRVRRALSRDMSRGGNVFSDTMERSFGLNRSGAM